MAHHRKKVAGHKLDYDCKKRHGEQVRDKYFLKVFFLQCLFSCQGTGMVESEKKFADSYKAAQHAMHNVIQNEQEYVMQIHALSTSLNVGSPLGVRSISNFNKCV